MGHVPIAGPGGSLPALAELRGRVVYIHINDTNPILDANSPEASLVQRTRIEIAMDGMELDVRRGGGAPAARAHSQRRPRAPR